MRVREIRRFISWLSGLPWWVLILIGFVIGVLMD